MLDDPNRMFPRDLLNAAARVCDPSIDAGDIDEHVRDYRLRAARCRVRLVVAALCGIEVGEELARENAQKVDAIVLLRRETVQDLQAALLNDSVVSAIEAAVGSEKAAAVLGSVSLL